MGPWHSGCASGLKTRITLVRLQQGQPEDGKDVGTQIMDDRIFNPEIIQSRIKQLRKERKMSKKVFSAFIGSTTGSNVCWWERGERTPSVYYLFQIAQRCGVSADWIIGLTDERNPVLQEVKA